jgi:hypothetical protein
MTPDVTQVKVIENYQIEATFANGEKRRFDMQPYLGYPAFTPLKEQAIFSAAHVKHGVVSWNDEIDLSPDTLYLRGTPT